MTDSLSSADIARMEAIIESDMKAKDKESMDKAIDKNKFFPKTLKEFLKKEMGKKLPHEEHRKQAEQYALGKGFTIPKEFKITEFKWHYRGRVTAVPAIAIRDPFGRFRGWFKLPKK